MNHVMPLPNATTLEEYVVTRLLGQGGVAGLLDLEKRQGYTFSEIAYRPVGYLMTLDSEVPDGRPVDILFFTDYRYNDQKEFSLRHRGEG
ncbi:MAG: hypothetical protein A4E60_01043 [Syntrophorhabdus sp. PtaB.Bin047]|nr:MAG: hypothetical protein A4E60_01043 [Syntrophorhabdus sp. PtaB.Bin047]